MRTSATRHKASSGGKSPARAGPPQARAPLRGEARLASSGGKSPARAGPPQARAPLRGEARLASSGGNRLTLSVQYAVARTGLPAAASLRRWASVALERDVAATLRFVGLVEGRALNALYRGKDYATNVLTFVYDDAVPLAGDIVLCVPVLRREARAGGVTLRAHCAHLVVHGMLHLQGHDHATPREAARMEARETALLAALGVADPYAPRAAGERRRAGGR